MAVVVLPPPGDVEWTARLKARLFTDLSAVNRFDTRLFDVRLADVERIVENMQASERSKVAARLGKKLKALARVKADLTKPTRPGGFDQARCLLIDREVFFQHALFTLEKAPLPQHGV